MTEARNLTYDWLRQHLDDLLFIEHSAMKQFHDVYDTRPWTEKEFLSERDEKDQFSCVMTEDGRPVGFSIAYQVMPSYAHISRLAVLSAPQKKYGSSLIDFQLATFIKKEVRQCSVDLTINNKVVFKLYNDRGFVKLEGKELKDYLNFRKRDPKEYEGEQASHIAMMKKFV